MFKLGTSLVAAVRVLILTLLALPLAGCELVGNIFEAGMWTGVIVVVAVIALIVYGASRLFKK